MKRTAGIISLFIALTLLFTLIPAPVKAEAAYAKKISVKLKKGEDAYPKIQKALDDAAAAGTKKKQALVKLPAGTYYISNTLCIGSNTCLQLNEKTVIRKASDTKLPFLYMLRCCSDHTNKVCTKGGYTDTSNITVKGGTWDCEFARYNGGDGGAVISFTNTTKLKIQNVTVCNSYAGHLIELAGVKNCTILGCTFYGFEANASGTAKEAVQLDYCDPDLVGNGGPYDDSPCVNVTIKNCTFKDFPRAIGSHCSVDRIYHRDITITGNTFTDISGFAVYGFNVVGMNVSDNTFTRVGSGILVKNCSRNAKNAVYDRLPGVKAEKVADNDYKITISDNTINTLSVKAEDMAGSENSESTMGKGIDIYCEAEDPIKNITIKNNKIIADACGLFLTNVSDVNASDNTIDRSSGAYDVTISKYVEEGLKLYGVSGSFDNNSISSSGTDKYENGVAARDGSDITINGLTIGSTGKTGLAVYSSKVTASNLKISGAVSHGITVSYEGTLKLSDSEIYKNGGKGISATNSSSLDISTSNIHDNTDTGINAMEGCSTTVVDSTIASNGKHGIYTKATTAKITGCTIKNNTEFGLCLADTAYELSGNTIDSNGRKPYYFSGSSSGSMN